MADVMSTWTQQQGYPVLTVDAKQVIIVLSIQINSHAAM